MADLQEQIQAILGDPETMGQITAIAKALTGGTSGPSPTPENAQEVEFVPVEHPTTAQDSSPDLSALLGSLGGGQVDPKLLQIALRLYGEYSAQDNEKAVLLAALKPFLREERREKLEKAEQLARLSRVVRVALQLYGEEGEGRV